MGQEVCVVDLRDGGEKGSLNPLDLAVRCGTDAGAVARSFASEIIERAPDVAVLHEHRLRGLRSPCLAAIEPTIPQGALGAPLPAIFALVLARASYRYGEAGFLARQRVGIRFPQFCGLWVDGRSQEAKKINFG